MDRRYTGAIGKACAEAGHGPEYGTLMMASQIDLGLYTDYASIYPYSKINFH